MTLTAIDLALYAFSIFLLFLVPGPVWVALIARALASGFSGAWPLALGVAVGDIFWPLGALYGINQLQAFYVDLLLWLKYVAVLIFFAMGVQLIRRADIDLALNSKLAKSGLWAGFSAGLLVILCNPKAILFYMGVLPGFFELQAITLIDIAAICAISSVVPLLGNLSLGLSVHGARALLNSPLARKRLNLVSGWALLCVALAIFLAH